MRNFILFIVFQNSFFFSDCLLPPSLIQVEGKDDETGEDLVQREDDKPESVRVRLQAFAETVQPLLDHYSAQGVLNAFDGSDHPDLVAADKRTDAIYKSLKPFLESKHAELKK